MANHWGKPLTEPIATRRDGTLSTLLDGAEMLIGKSAGVTKDDALVYTVELLMRAAETGEDSDRREATEALARLLAAKHWR